MLKNDRIKITLETLLREYCFKNGYNLRITEKCFGNGLHITFYYQDRCEEYIVNIDNVHSVLTTFETIKNDLSRRMANIKMKWIIENSQYGLCSSEPMSTHAFPSDLITNVIFNDPATIVFWIDGTKTVVKAQDGEAFDPEKGLAMAISKKFLGNNGSYYNYFIKWLDMYEEKDV